MTENDDNTHPSFIFQVDKFQKEEKDAVIKKQLEGYKETCKIWPDHLKDLEKAFIFVKGKTVLDVGCSDGQVMELLKKQGFEVKGVDIATEALNKAELKGLNVVYGVAQNLPFGNETFDTVFCSHVIEHLIDFDVALKEFYRVLKPNGRVIILTENLNSLKERILFLFGKIPTVMADPHHYSFFNFKRLEEEMRKAGFQSIIRDGSQIGFPIPKHCFFTHKLDVVLSESFCEKIIMVGIK